MRLKPCYYIAGELRGKVLNFSPVTNCFCNLYEEMLR